MREGDEVEVEAMLLRQGSLLVSMRELEEGDGLEEADVFVEQGLS